MKTCSVCSTENSDEALYCSKCGANLPSIPETSATNAPITPQVGKAANVSFILGLVSLGIFIFLLLLESIPDRYGLTLVDKKSGIIILVGLLLGLTYLSGIIFAIIGLLRKSEKKKKAVWGLALNSTWIILIAIALVISSIFSRGDTGVIKGKVTFNGTFINNIDINLVDRETGESLLVTTTNDLGDYEFEGLPKGNFGLGFIVGTQRKLSCQANREDLEVVSLKGVAYDYALMVTTKDPGFTISPNTIKVVDITLDCTSSTE